MLNVDQQARERGYQSNDLNARRLLLIAAVLIVSLGIVALAAHWLTNWYAATSHGATRGTQAVSVPAPEPHLQTQPQTDLLKHRAAKRALLNGYGWIDRKKGVVHIPIDRAMALTVERSRQQEDNGS